MLGLTLILMANAQAAPPAPVVKPYFPPPVFIPTPTGQPVRPIGSADMAGYDHHAPPIPLRIEVRSNGNILWSDTLKVGFAGQSSHSISRYEPPDQPCGVRGFRANMQSSLRVDLGFEPGRDAGDKLRANVVWVRPMADQGCERGAGSRSVSLNQIIALEPGATRKIEGDGGLVVTITRPPVPRS